MIYSIGNKKFAYYHAPKCGSRTILGWAVLIENPNLYLENPDWFKESRVGEYGEMRSLFKVFPNTSQDFKSGNVTIANSEFRFCVVRNPVDRFLSGYVNRVLFHKNLCGYEMPIGEFIENFDVIKKINANIETHFRPQVKFYGKNPNIFHKIYKMNEFGLIKKELEIANNIVLPNIHLQQNGEIKKPILTENQINWIKDKYSEDYEVYGEYF